MVKSQKYFKMSIFITRYSDELNSLQCQVCYESMGNSRPGARENWEQNVNINREVSNSIERLYFYVCK